MAISASRIYYCINKNSLKDALLFKKVISNRTCIILVFKLIVLLINIIFEEHYFRGTGWHAGWTLGPSVTNYRQIATRQIYYYYCYNIPGTSVRTGALPDNFPHFLDERVWVAETAECCLARVDLPRQRGSATSSTHFVLGIGSFFRRPYR